MTEIEKDDDGILDSKRTVGRPPENALTRVLSEFRPQNRIPVGGFRDILTVEGQDPAYVYRFVLDTNEDGARILRFLRGGYEFVQAKDHLIGQENVFRSKNNMVGSIVRVPAGARSSGMYLYLMRIKREWYEEDQKQKHQRGLDVERSMTRPRDVSRDDGQYGKVNIERSDRF